jgi:hypothetical protein
VKLGKASEDLMSVKSNDPVAVAEFGESAVFCCGFPWTNDTVAAVSRASVLTKTHGGRAADRTAAVARCARLSQAHTCEAVAVTEASFPRAK